MTSIPLFWSLPFVILLLGIALLPLGFPHFWEKNRNKALIALSLALPVGVFLIGRDPHALLHAGLEYVSFIILLGSLFVVSGGILLTGDIEARPATNTGFLFLGAVLASLIGTTGASMLLIRPMLATNAERRHTHHIPIFFIFLVSNFGGLLTPLGDPPLFLGFLRGVPFFWTLKLLPVWGLSVGILLTIFFVLDTLAYRKETKAAIKADNTRIKPLRLSGMLNFVFLAGVVAGVFAPTPWRELIMAAMAVASYFSTSKKIHEQNRFGFGPILEVAILFAGIFVTMIPALAYLREHAVALGITTPRQYFWLAGLLSSFLDNAPTYLTFFSMAQGLPPAGTMVAGVNEALLTAISVGAVLMGANSYIGNGPNFMVKAIADESGVKMPSFFGYMLWSVGILGPIYVLLTFMVF